MQLYDRRAGYVPYDEACDEKETKQVTADTDQSS